MGLINSVGFRLPFNRVWAIQHSINFTRLHYSRFVPSIVKLLNWLPRLFSKAVFLRYEFVYSNLLFHKRVNSLLSLQIHYFSRFFVGVTRFLKFILNVNRRILFKHRSLRYYVLFVEKLLHLNTIFYFYLIRFAVFKTLNSFFSVFKNVYRISLRSLDRHAFPATYVATLIKRKMKSRSNLARLVARIAQSFQKKKRPMWKGIRISVAGRFSRQQRAQHKIFTAGVVAANTLSSKVDYTSIILTSRYGQSMAKIWINYK